MARPDLGELAATAWEHVLRVTPDPFRNDDLWRGFGAPRLSYQQDLDKPLWNSFGDVIPRRAIVESNIMRLGDPHLSPRRLPA